MKGAGVKKKTQVVNDAGEAETAVETAGGSGKRSGDGGFGSDDGGGGDSVLREMGDDRRTEDEEEEDDDEDEEDEEEGGGGGGKEERPKLDEGFFEIEAIRRKRVRKVSSFTLFVSYTFGMKSCLLYSFARNLTNLAEH